MSEQTAGPTPEAARVEMEQALFEIRRVIAGQDAMLERALVCLLAQGHLLIEGAGPREDADDQDHRRRPRRDLCARAVHPDLVPSDLVGDATLPRGRRHLRHGARARVLQLPARGRDQPGARQVQSALLEVMQERQVTIGHDTHLVPEPFLVMATQNPIESEGTYPLPEAQIDRFMLKVVIGYPQHDEELTVVQRQLVEPPELRQVLSLEDLMALQRAVFDIYVDPALVSYAVDIATATREPAAHGLPDSRSTSRTAPARAGRSASSRARGRSR